ncbi:helix-turn-helix domain-containing protein [Streptomyces pratens]|uniref:Helix-turn-helix domain-containing protein n=1 Tax=Streptomyces pratens TaxID=887456 RepID=A0ABW1MBT9_9ACTN
MGRRENPIDRTVPARAGLADFLRARRQLAELTYRQMAAHSGAVSAATLERAASGTVVPAWDTVEEFILATVSEKDFFLEGIMDHGRRLWIRARRATRAPYYVHAAPDPTLLATAADFLRALRQQHVWAGYPTPGEMERTSGPGELPTTTVRRIIAGEALPVDPQQAIAFLKACYVVTATDLEQWLAAAVRGLQDVPARSRNLAKWVQAHQRLAEQAQTDAVAEVRRLPAPLEEKQAA